MKKQKIVVRPYRIYVPQNSGLADELNYWGWWRIRREEVKKYQNYGFVVYYCD